MRCTLLSLLRQVLGYVPTPCAPKRPDAIAHLPSQDSAPKDKEGQQPSAAAKRTKGTKLPVSTLEGFGAGKSGSPDGGAGQSRQDKTYAGSSLGPTSRGGYGGGGRGGGGRAGSNMANGGMPRRYDQEGGSQWTKRENSSGTTTSAPAAPPASTAATAAPAGAVVGGPSPPAVAAVAAAAAADAPPQTTATT